MQKANSIRRLAVLILIVAACLLLIGGGSRYVRPLAKQVTASEVGTVQSQSSATVITSLTKLRPVGFKKLADTTIEVTLRNDYDKDITAVAAFADGTFYRREYLVAEVERLQKLARGASGSFFYPKPSIPGEKVEILAVVFSDRTGDGDQRQIQRILDERRGMKIQLGRILPHFQLLGNTSSVTAPLQLATIKAIAESLPMETDERSPLSQGLESGLRHGRAYILRRYISELEQALAMRELTRGMSAMAKNRRFGTADTSTSG